MEEGQMGRSMKFYVLCFLFEYIIFGGRRLDADPLYTNELDTINFLLHHKKHVRGSSDIGFVAFIFA